MNNLNLNGANTERAPVQLASLTAVDTPHTNTNARPAAAKDQTPLTNAIQSGITAEILAEDMNISMAIGAEDVIEGKIKVGSGRSLVIRGKVEGEIECTGRVVVMPGAVVLGKIHAAALWVEGDIGDKGNPASVDVGDLHLGVNSRVIGDCTYDTMGVAMPNRGVRGQMIPRSESEINNA